MRIVVENLACRRSGRLVFEGLSFTLTPGEALIVTGRNGAGKSSLLALLAGRLRPEAGAIRVDFLGESSLAECLHLVGHRDALKGALTAEENLAFVRDLLGTPALSPREALDAVGLAHAATLPVDFDAVADAVDLHRRGEEGAIGRLSPRTGRGPLAGA